MKCFKLYKMSGTYKMVRWGVGRWLRVDKMLAMQAESLEFRA